MLPHLPVSQETPLFINASRKHKGTKDYEARMKEGVMI